MMKSSMTTALVTLTLLALLPFGGVFGASVAPEYVIPVRLFYRAFCPACQWFITDPLLELMRDREFQAIIQLRLIPAAGMYEQGDGNFWCEGGAEECDGQRWHACVIDKDRDDVVKHFGNIACLERDESGDAEDWTTKLKNCLTEAEREQVKQCFDHKSKSILSNMITEEKTNQVQWMPYIVVGEKVMGSLEQGVGLSEMHQELCQTYNGPERFYPEVCKAIVPKEQKQFAAEVDPTSEVRQAPEAETSTTTEVAVREKPQAVSKIRLEVYWRAYCPGCMYFFNTPLLQLMRDESFRKVIEFVPVPAAGTYIDINGNFGCNGGQMECIGHKWLSCAIEESPELVDQIAKLTCLESREDSGLTWEARIDKCFDAGSRVNVHNCFYTKSDGLLRKYVEMTNRLTALLWMPFVVINGRVLGDLKTGISYQMLEEAMCAAYTGPSENQPIPCRPKRLREVQPIEQPKTEVKMVRPCPPKKKGTDATPAATLDDPPTIGRGKVKKPVPTVDTLEDKKPIRMKLARGLGEEEDGDFNTFSMVLLTVLVLGMVLGLVARHFTSRRRSKKYA